MRALLRNPFVLAGGFVVLVVGFLLFRPDTLFTDVRVAESLEDAFTTSTPGTISAADETTAATTTNSPAVAEIVEIVSGAFIGIDHQAAGTATVYSQDLVSPFRRTFRGGTAGVTQSREVL
ncbi:MAG: hypothetical protein LC739_13920 [Actinobacteria bacterium]|nr:hypothetical protein [Actinomycetota bacterium]